MTENQRKFFYFPAWHRCAAANQWRMESGRLVCDRAENVLRSEMHQRIWAEAEIIARADHRSVQPEDFRHAVNGVVNEGKLSSEQLKPNWRVNQAVALFNLLREPCLKTWVAYMHPGMAEKIGTLTYMRSLAPDHVWEAISLNAFDTRAWQSLNDQQKDWLISEVKGRKNHPRKLKMNGATAVFVETIYGT